MTAVDVAIVGAGAAGVGAARGLAGSGLSVLLLEAGVRVGGRAWTERLDGMALDMGCGWLHSGERNGWVAVADAAGIAVNRSCAAWGEQWRDLGFTAGEREAASAAVAAWQRRLTERPPASDCAADALDPACPWNGWIEALSGFLNGAPTVQVSAADAAAYDDAATDSNWRVPGGYGRLVAASLPAVPLRLGTPVSAIRFAGEGVALDTGAGTLRARATILAVPTAVLATGSLALPPDARGHAEAAAGLPLGQDEKLFLALDGAYPFEPETALVANPRDPATPSFYIRPLGAPVIEVFLGGPGAEAAQRAGPAAAFEGAIDRLAALVGSDVRRSLRPLAASAWGRTDRIGGAYSHALPGRAGDRARLAVPVADRLFFAGEATHPTDFSTAHGALASGLRAADEVLAALGRA